MKKSLQRVLSAVLAVVMLIGVIQVVGFAAQKNEAKYLQSGEYSVRKISKKEIYESMKEIKYEKIFDTAPVLMYNAQKPGKAAAGALNNALYELNLGRKLAGLKPVKLDPTLCENSQYGAVLLAYMNKGLNHKPAQPKGMSKEFYDKGYNSTSKSNLYMSYKYTLDGKYVGYNAMANSVWTFMDDKDSSNISRLGHRRWQLNPAMEKTGFGIAVSGLSGKSGNVYVTEYSFDESGKAGDFDFIGWPASGNFPTTYFNSNVPWSVSLNPEKYAAPIKADLKITINGNGEKYVLDGGKAYSTSNKAYLGVNNDDFGVPNCIIFRPDFKKEYKGVYKVTIEGIKDKSGKNVRFVYLVDFFDPIETAKFKIVEEKGKKYYKNGYGEMKTGWQVIDNKQYYFNSNGAMAMGWQTIDGKDYYFDSKSGVMVTGWLKDGNTWYFFNSKGQMQKGWIKVNDKDYYLGADGKMRTGWQTIDGKKYYFDSTGAMVTGKTQIGDKIYMFDENGLLVKGWVAVGSDTYYFDENGEMVTGYKTIDGKRYYFAADGKMAKGWVQFDSTWSYFKADGTLAIGWYKIGDYWYYSDANGVMQTGWEKIDGTWYLLRGNGAMVTGWWKIGSTWYYFYSNGAMKTGWLKLDTTWYYMDASGAMQVGWEKIGSTWYFFYSNGAMKTGWLKIDTTWYYMDASGAMQTGWEKIGSTWYYFYSNGAMKTGWLKIGPTWYYMDSTGAMQTGWHWING